VRVEELQEGLVAGGKRQGLSTAEMNTNSVPDLSNKNKLD
jgi:hypothetical protein